MSPSLGPAGIVGGGSECTVLSLPSIPLLRVCVHGVCVFTAVCVHLGWDKCRAQIPSMGHHTWSYVTSLSLSLCGNYCSSILCEKIRQDDLIIFWQTMFYISSMCIFNIE